MSTFLEKFAPTVADVSHKQIGAALPGAAGAAAGYAAWRHLFPTRTWLRHYNETHKVPAVGVLTGMAAGEVAHEMYRGGNVTREVVANALGLLGAILLPKYVPSTLRASGFAREALRHVAYPVAGFLAGKGAGFWIGEKL